jgi:ferric-dicitrate binding protein FerR (iron transport regulator)
MEDKTEVRDLVRRYLDNQVTREEREQVLKMLASGEIDEAMGEELFKQQMQYLDSPDFQEVVLSEKEKRRAQKIKGDMLETILDPTYKRSAGGTSWWMVASAAAVIFVAIWFVEWPRTRGDAPMAAEETAVPEQVYRGRKFVRLDDNSTIILNEGSELRHSGHFSEGGTREVSLVGEAYFDIAHDSKKPFIIHLNGVAIKVLGTAFNVKAYPDQKEVKVTVTRGLVEVTDGDKKVYGQVRPDEELAVDVASGQSEAKAVKADEVKAWTDKFLIFDDANMAEAAEILHKRFQVKVVFGDELLKKCRIQATFLNDQITLTEVLDALTLSLSGIHYTQQEDGTILLTGTACY